MVVDISQVLKGEGAVLEFSENVNLDAFSFNGNSIKFLKPVSVRGKFENLGNVIFLSGSADVSLDAVCAKCLDGFEKNMNFSFEERFSKSPVSDEEAEDIVHIFGNEIELNDVIIRELCLNLPISFLCSEDCKGLCPVCGKNLNKEQCSCETDEIDPRLAVLKTFLQ